MLGGPVRELVWMSQVWFLIPHVVKVPEASVVTWMGRTAYSGPTVPVTMSPARV
jgi:hypothetical protein